MTIYEMAVEILQSENKALRTHEIIQCADKRGWKMGGGNNRERSVYGTLQHNLCRKDTLIDRVGPDTWSLKQHAGTSDERESDHGGGNQPQLLSEQDTPIDSRSSFNSTHSNQPQDETDFQDGDEIASVAADDDDDPEGLDTEVASWGDYPLDDLLIRHESRTIYDVVRRIREGRYVMDPDFQRDFIWKQGKQSKLIESVTMRIPLPVFYLAEDGDGRMVVVDGLQRLSTFLNFIKNDLKLSLADRQELHGKRFSDLSPKLKNRIEDCNLIFYIIDSRVPERAKLDIFERVNSGSPLTRQQMRNALFNGRATAFLRDESQSELFEKATGRGLDRAKMRDREFVNRFCAFRLLGAKEYRGDMDEFLAKCLVLMNDLSEHDLSLLSQQFQRGLQNNSLLFERQAFRRPNPDQKRLNVLNASLWDVSSTILSQYKEQDVVSNAEEIRCTVYDLLANEEFLKAITRGTSDTVQVRTRFEMFQRQIEGILGAVKN